MSQYNAIATQYVSMNAHDIWKIINALLCSEMNNVKGQQVLDLACGDGFYSRILKRMGASRVVGVDVSEGMLALAETKEKEEPQGIKYLHSTIQNMGKIGEFDSAFAVFLLHYAGDRNEMLQMCSAIFQNLKPGGRFFAINTDGKKLLNFSSEANNSAIWYTFEPTRIKDGDPVKVSLKHGNTKIEFEHYIYSRETYEEVLKAAGFNNVISHSMMLPLELAESEMWRDYVHNGPQELIECQKPLEGLDI